MSDVRTSSADSICLTTELLVLPDGTVLTNSLTPAMAELLKRLNLRVSDQTQGRFRSALRSETEAQGGPAGFDQLRTRSETGCEKAGAT